MVGGMRRKDEKADPEPVALFDEGVGGITGVTVYDEESMF